MAISSEPSTGFSGATPKAAVADNPNGEIPEVITDVKLQEEQRM